MRLVLVFLSLPSTACLVAPPIVHGVVPPVVPCAVPVAPPTQSDGVSVAPPTERVAVSVAPPTERAAAQRMFLLSGLEQTVSGRCLGYISILSVFPFAACVRPLLTRPHHAPPSRPSVQERVAFEALVERLGGHVVDTGFYTSSCTHLVVGKRPSPHDLTP